MEGWKIKAKLCVGVWVRKDKSNGNILQPNWEIRARPLLLSRERQWEWKGQGCHFQLTIAMETPLSDSTRWSWMWAARQEWVLDKGSAHAPSRPLGIFKALCVGQEGLRAGLTSGLAGGQQDTSGGRGKQKPDLDDSRYSSSISLSHLPVSWGRSRCYSGIKRFTKLGQRIHMEGIGNGFIMYCTHTGMCKLCSEGWYGRARSLE